jgi:hypothetical protein
MMPCIPVRLVAAVAHLRLNKHQSAVLRAGSSEKVMELGNSFAILVVLVAFSYLIIPVGYNIILLTEQKMTTDGCTTR